MQVFTPVKIGKVEVKNRLVFPSMCTFYSDEKGSITPRIKEFLRRRAAGGVGMIITPGTPYGLPGKGRPAISEEEHIAGWKDLKKMVSEYGVSLFCQLHPFRMQAGEKVMRPQDYTLDEIHAIINAYAAGAARARRANVDGVEIHGAHTHEIAQFLSPFYNRRQDAYGGDLAGRSRFALEIVKTIKKLAGKDFPVIFRFSVEERIPGGRDLAESRQLARLLAEGGADALHVSVGTIDSPQWVCVPMDIPPGFSINLTSEVKKAVSIPVIAVGRIDDISLATQVIDAGHADLVSLGRALLADADLPEKSRRGKSEQIRRCIACNQGCQANSSPEIFCLQDPGTGRETTLVYSPVSSGDRKTILIAGAGPAGLEAAGVLSERGHRVKLYEQNDQVGGTFLVAAKPPFKEGILEVIRYRRHRLKENGVEINLNQKVDLTTIQKEKPDVVIVATGSVPAYPSFPIKGKGFYSADEVLSREILLGNKILVLGGGMVGCEVADYLANQGHKVDIVEQLPSVAADLNKARRIFLLERLQKNGVRLITGAKVLEVNLPNVKLAIGERQETYGGYDSAVLAMGRQPDNELYTALKNSLMQIKVFIMGDASSPRTALEAICEAAQLSASI